MPDPKRPAAIDAPSPARLYASLIGGVLVIIGIVGFFYSVSFGSPGDVDKALGAFSVNGWDNILHILTGALGLLVAGFAARRYALWIGALYLAAGVWGLALGDGDAILGIFPVSTADDLLHLALGALGIAAALATTSRAASSAAPPKKAARVA